jgi:uncharacterized membrane protein
VQTRSMPQSNMTAMTDEERLELGRWIAHGAVVGPIDTTSALPPLRPASPQAVAVDPATAAKTIYTERCVLCHGAAGGGDGPASIGLTPRPRNFSDTAWQGAKNDDAIASAIVKGGAASGLSPLMPPNPDLTGRPEVLAELVKVVRGFEKK